jgi:hypothetical protein
MERAQRSWADSSLFILFILSQSLPVPVFYCMVKAKARRIPGCRRGASEAHIRSDLQRAGNYASSPEDKRMSLILNANLDYRLDADKISAPS